MSTDDIKKSYINNSSYYFEEIEREHFNKENKRNFGFSVSKRHNMDMLTSIVLLFCYHDVFQKYGVLIPTVDCDESVHTNQMGIMFAADVDSDYLNEIKSLFYDGYEYRPNDFLHYDNIGKIDINEIKRRYPNLSLSSIRDVTLYSKNELVREKLFEFMNCVNVEFQFKICSLIKPIIVEIADVTGVPWNSDLIDVIIDITKGRQSKKYNMIMDVINGKLSKRDDMNGLYYSYLEDVLKSYNLVYMYEYEYLFQELLMDVLDKINEDNIDMLIKAKEYSLQNIPEVTGELTWEPNYVMKSYQYSDADREAACGDVYTVYDKVQDGYKAVCTVCYGEEELKNEKNGIRKVIKMLIDGNIDYKDLLECDCGPFINDLMDFISRDKVKKICK